jgi:tetratricopeptide (TPR) repeat protein
MKGSFQEAIAEFQKARQLGDHPLTAALLGRAYAVSGRREEALRMLDELKEIAKQRYDDPFAFAVLYAAFGEKDQAFQWLEMGYQDHALVMTVLKVDPRFDNLRSDPRFADLLRRVGLPP